MPSNERQGLERGQPFEAHQIVEQRVLELLRAAPAKRVELLPQLMGRERCFGTAEKAIERAVESSAIAQVHRQAGSPALDPFIAHDANALREIADAAIGNGRIGKDGGIERVMV